MAHRSVMSPPRTLNRNAQSRRNAPGGTSKQVGSSSDSRSGGASGLPGEPGRSALEREPLRGADQVGPGVSVHSPLSRARVILGDPAVRQALIAARHFRSHSV